MKNIVKLIITTIIGLNFYVSSLSANTEEHLSQHGVSMQVARDFLMNNISNLQTVFNVCKQFGVNNDMIADILQNDFPGLDGKGVSNFFDVNGLNSNELGFSTSPGGTVGLVANAGIDQTVETTSTVRLDASASSNNDADFLYYSWTFISKPEQSNAALSDLTSVDPIFTADVAGIYVLSLIVNDGNVSSSSDTVTVSTPLEMNVDYTADDGLSVKMNSISIEEKTGSYIYSINYTLTNNTMDKEIEEGSFTAFYKDKDYGLGQSGFFGSLFPGDTKTRDYSFETLKSEAFGKIGYNKLFSSNSVSSMDLVWNINTEDILATTYTDLRISNRFSLALIEGDTYYLSLSGTDKNGNIVKITDNIVWSIDKGPSVGPHTISEAGAFKAATISDSRRDDMLITATHSGTMTSIGCTVFKNEYAKKGNTGTVTYNYTTDYYIIDKKKSQSWNFIFSSRSSSSLYGYSLAILEPKYSIEDYSRNDLEEIEYSAYNNWANPVEIGTYIAKANIVYASDGNTILQYDYIIAKIINITEDEVTIEYKVIQ